MWTFRTGTCGHLEFLYSPPSLAYAPVHKSQTLPSLRMSLIKDVYCSLWHIDTFIIIQYSETRGADHLYRLGSGAKTRGFLDQWASTLKLKHSDWKDHKFFAEIGYKFICCFKRQCISHNIPCAIQTSGYGWILSWILTCKREYVRNNNITHTPQQPLQYMELVLNFSYHISL